MLRILNVYYILALVNNACYANRNKPKKCLFFIKVIFKDLFIKALSLFKYCRGADLSQKKPYRNDTRKPSNRTRSKRIYKHKAINSI
jgi:hypothetical protein